MRNNGEYDYLGKFQHNTNIYPSKSDLFGRKFSGIATDFKQHHNRNLVTSDW